MKTLFFLILYFGFLTPSSSQCNCDESNSIEIEIEQYDQVFSGLVTKKDIISKSERDVDLKKQNLILVRYEVKVLKSYKRANTFKKLILYSMHDAASCGLKLDSEEEYIIFAKKGTYITSNAQDLLTGAERKGYWINKCSKTALLDAILEAEIEKSIED